MVSPAITAIHIPRWTYISAVMLPWTLPTYIMSTTLTSPSISHTALPSPLYIIGSVTAKNTSTDASRLSLARIMSAITAAETNESSIIVISSSVFAVLSSTTNIRLAIAIFLFTVVRTSFASFANPFPT